MSRAKKFPNIINPETINSLTSEFAVYRCLGLEADELEMPVDIFWARMAKQKKPGTSLPQFPVLAKFCQSLCVLPHGNADCERVFSMLTHIKTEFRNQLGNDTKEALLAVGRNSLQNMSQCCYEVKVGRYLIKSAKAATMKALEEYHKKAEATA